MRRLACLGLVLGALVSVSRAGDPPPAPGDNGGAPAPVASATTLSARLLAETDRILARVKESHYTHQRFVDEASAVYDFDCSGYVGYALQRVCPEAEADLGTHRKDTRPHTSEFVLLLGSIPKGEARGHWLRVARVQDLEPGDVIAWESPGKKPDGETIQPHTMVVHGPVRKDPADPDELIVPITDSTHSPTHTRDSRKESGATGVGTGTIGLIVDGDGAPTAYRWSVGKTATTRPTKIVLGRVR